MAKKCWFHHHGTSLCDQPPNSACMLRGQDYLPEAHTAGCTHLGNRTLALEAPSSSRVGYGR